MQTFASLLRSCALLALFTGSSGQSVPAGTLDEIRVEFRAMNEVLRNENALKFEEVKKENTALRIELEVKNEALRLELKDLRGLLQSQPRRTDEEREQMPFLDCINTDDSDADNIYFDGCNLHVRSGEGSTDARTNGKGNLIIGYNESPVDDDYYLMEVPESAEGPKKVDGLEDTEAKKDVSNSRGGSHNLIIGDQHEYTSFGGIVTGQRNEISNEYSAVVGGFGNAATGEYSFISGGYGNAASGSLSSIFGGDGNKATGYESSISGGYDNTATGRYSSISGGYDNTASGGRSSISGGFDNTASGDGSSVLGGSSNDAQGEAAVVTGGFKNKAIGDLASVVGGKRNKAWKKFSVVTGA